MLDPPTPEVYKKAIGKGSAVRIILYVASGWFLCGNNNFPQKAETTKSGVPLFYFCTILRIMNLPFKILLGCH